MVNTGYFRQPTIHGDTICFVCEDDLWTVPAAGGIARRLTANLGDTSHPALSPDGALLAFTSREEHHPEVYVMAAGGGPAQRLTWLGATATAVAGWTPDGRIIFTSDAAQPFAAMHHAYAVAAEGGPPTPLHYGVVRNVAFEPGGSGVVLGRHTIDPARWKRYRGGTAGNLWVDAKGTGVFRRLVDLHTNMGSPMWIGRRIWFISDHEGIGNLYSCRPDGKDLRRHTDHGEYYARFARTDGTRIVYQHAADLWLLDPENDTNQPMAIDHRSPQVQRNRRFVPADRFMTGWSVHPDGHSVAVESRGKPFTMPFWEESAHQYGAAHGVRYRFPRFAGAGIAVVSDEGGEDAVEVHAPGEVARRVGGLDVGIVLEMTVAPVGSTVALANQRHELIVIDLDSGKGRVLDRSEHGALGEISWSPDARWVAYSFAASGRTRSIKICDVGSGEAHLVTTPRFWDGNPSWDAQGRYLFFLSVRSFDPVYDAVYFDLGFPKGVVPCLITLGRDQLSPFLPAPRGMAPIEPPPSGKPRAAESAPPPVVAIDFAGIERRVLAFPVPEGRWSAIVGIGDKVLLQNNPIEGSAAMSPYGGGESKGTIELYDLSEQKHEVLVEGVAAFEVSRDGRTLVYAAGNRLRAIPAGAKPPSGMDSAPPGRGSGWIDLGRIRLAVDPPTEWRQMSEEAWRLQRDTFWTPDMSGTDWSAVRDRYLPLIDKVASRTEFSDLMWEMQGELGTSHAYELGGDYRPVPEFAMGLLGADLSFDAKTGRWSFAHIVRGDSWNPAADSPLDAPGFNVADGDTLLAVGGHRVGPDMPPAALLVHQAGMAIELTVADPKGRKPRRITVTTVRDERPARYREWVECNREKVHSDTKGSVGYVHVPNMMGLGFAEFHRSYFSEVERDGLVVDVRYNGGGHVSQLILEKLARCRLGYDVSRWGPPQPYPQDSPPGPIVILTNENAGSDGDIFTHCAKLLELGPVVGKRTWGGVVGINARHRLVDGSITTQPEYSFWFRDVGWGVENYGTDPTHDVDIKPQDYAAGRDPQMDKALQLIGAALRRHKPLRPDTTRPKLGLPVLPPRA